MYARPYFGNVVPEQIPVGSLFRNSNVNTALDASIGSGISSKLCFRMSFLAFLKIVYIYTYSMPSRGVLFSIISLRFLIRAHVCDDRYARVVLFLCLFCCARRTLLDHISHVPTSIFTLPM